MFQDWDILLATMDEDKKAYYKEIRERANRFNIPKMTPGILIEPNDFDAFLMACVIKADKLYRLTEFSVELYDYYLNSFKRRFKNPVYVWYNKAALHCVDSVTEKMGHFRLIEQAEYCYGA